MRRATAVTSDPRGDAFRVPTLRGDASGAFRGSAALAPVFALNSASVTAAATGGSNNESMAVPPGVPAPPDETTGGHARRT